MASASPSPSPPPAAAIEESADEAPATDDLPLTMAASVVLDQLPRDAHEALRDAGELTQAKVTIRLSALPNTPSLRQPRFKCSSTQRFEAIVRFVRKKLALKDHESVFCYVNQVFAPGLDEGVGNLWRCFRVNDELVVSYSITQAFG